MKKMIALFLTLVMVVSLVACGSEEQPSQIKDTTAPTESTTPSIPTEPEATEPQYSQGLEYAPNEDGSGYVVTGIGTCLDADIVIPAEYEGKPITAIRKTAFREYTFIHSVAIPDGVDSIGYDAFSGCDNLAEVHYSSVLEDWLDIKFDSNGNPLQNGADLYCDGVLVTDYTVSVDHSQNLRGCTSLTSITIPADVTSSIVWAFSGCTGLTSIQVDEGNEKYHSVDNCVIETATKTLVLGCKDSIIPNDGSVTVIGDGAFSGHAKLQSINIPGSVICIGQSAFYGCTSLTSITIPDSVTEIGSSAFYGCTSLTGITIPDSVVEIGYGTFADCTSLTSVTIPDSVTEIGDSAFSGCTSLTSVTIPDSVVDIDDFAFHGCTSLTSITIPDSVVEIGYNAFGYCTSLTTIHYNGTIAQWNDITKNAYWDSDTGEYTIYCTDGEIKK